MNLSKKAKRQIKKLLKKVIRKKLQGYKPETEHKPFHHRLIGKDRYAMFSFIHSMNTTFGMSLFEQIAETIAKNEGFKAKRQIDLKGEVNKETSKIIDKIHNDLREGSRNPDFKKTLAELKETVEITENPKKIPDSRVDLYIKRRNENNYFDITSAKPNIKEFATLKRKLLKWTALGLSQNKNSRIRARLGIPYNPYYPKPYERWTLRGLYDLEKDEILIGKNFWNFLADKEIYEELLDVVEEVGKEIRPELDKFFAQFRD